MSKTCCLWIANNSGHRLKLNRYHCNFMRTWNFGDIDQDAQKCFEVEFSDRFVKSEKGCSGLAEFVLDGTSYQFQLQAIRNQKCSYTLQVDWTDVDLDVYAVFPPPVSSSNMGTLGWNSNFLCLTIQNKLHHVSNPMTPLPSDGVVEWMGYYSDIIGSLSLREVTLLCSHNSGTYQPSTKVPILPGFIRCQAQSLRAQLMFGIRVLDLRIAQSDIGEFVLSHDSWKTHYTLKQALQEVVQFIDRTTKELVILDFHRFNNLTCEDFNYSTLKDQVRGLLEDHYLPMFAGGLDMPLHDLWSNQASRKSRVVVAWNQEESRDDDMWPGVYHEWYRLANSESKLYAALDKTFSGDLGLHKGLWSVCVFQTPSPMRTPLKNAQNIHSKLDAWFHGCADWTLKANIISTDFTGEWNNITHATICANLLKGAKKVLH